MLKHRFGADSGKLIGIILFILLGAIIILTDAFAPALSATGHYTVAVIIITIGLWILKPFNIPFSISSGFLIAALLIIGLKPAAVLSGFSGNALWTLIPALFMGYALDKTHLGKRIAYFGMKTIKVSYLSLLIAWSAIGVVLSLLTPSITVRVVIVTPIARSCADVCGMPKFSRGRSLILLTAWLTAVVPGCAWLTGSLNGPILSGIYAGTGSLGEISFSEWLDASLLPVLLTSVLTIIAGYFVLRPKDKLSVPREVFRLEYKKLGKVTKSQIITGLVLVLSFLLFVTSSWHNIPAAAVCLLGLLVLTAFGIITRKEIQTAISWDLVIYIGTAMSFGTIFEEAGVTKWLSSIIVGAVGGLAQSHLLFVAVVTVFLFIWRFADIACFIPTFAIVASVVPAMSETYGISPYLWIPLLCLASNSFFMSYTNIFALTAETILDEDGWTKSHLTRYAVVYFAATLISCAVFL